MQNNRISTRVNIVNLNLHESQMNLSILTFLKETSMKKIFATLLVCSFLTAIASSVFASSCPQGSHRTSSGCKRN